MAAAVSAEAVRADDLRALVRGVVAALGAPDADAALLGETLVEADLEGIASHGVMLLPMYAERVRRGSVSLTATPVVAEDLGGLVVMDARRALGQVSALAATGLAVSRARLHGLALVAVRDAFHFGAAGHWARRIAAAGMVGFAFSNTRPLMPAPGGAERVVGNNPLAIAFPAAPGEPLVVDMAMSASAMGKIRLAAQKGEPIPPGWATDAEGAPTTDAAAAIKGMLLPAAGPKGFGLAVAIDLICGALSGGGIAGGVRPLYDELDQPYGCAHAFIAVDAARLHDGTGIAARVQAFAETLRGSRRAAGTDTVYAPGDLERARRARAGDACPLPRAIAAQLESLAAGLGLPHRLPPLDPTRPSRP